MTELNEPYMVVILDAEGQEVNVLTREIQEPRDSTANIVSFSTYEQAQMFYDQCKQEFPDCSIKILPRRM
ncbi:hypothetical protein [uncultured Marinococcus sp.]|uniref:hypothetical protein n=1 Tax=uncultured Marinococcus sp. TaxID=487012 RepID=UPI0026264A3A|nr:hypothetical protein [uncultured Marinococcus sp.]